MNRISQHPPIMWVRRLQLPKPMISERNITEIKRWWIEEWKPIVSKTNKLVFPWQDIQIICPLGSHIMTAADINHNSYHRLPPCPSNYLPQAPSSWSVPILPLIAWCIDLSRFSFLERSGCLSRSIRNARPRCEGVPRRTTEFLNKLQLGDKR
jgi:hypothetical protein